MPVAKSGSQQVNQSHQCGLPQQIIVLVVTRIVAVRFVSAWTNPVLKRVPGVVQVLAVVFGLACQVVVLACQVEPMIAFD